MQRLIEGLISPLLSLPRAVKRGIALALDAGLCVLTVWLAFYLRLGDWIPLSDGGWPAAAASLALALPIFIVTGLYRAVFRYVGWDALSTILQALIVYGIIYSAIFTAFGVDGVPRTVGIIQPILLFVAVGASRVFGRYFLGDGLRQRFRVRRKNVLIYGAGSTGRQLASALSTTLDTRVLAFVDDARTLQGGIVGGIRVWAPEDLEALVDRHAISEVYLAISAASRARRNEILGLIREVGVAVKTLPAITDIASGKVTVSDLRLLEPEDLLGRDIVAPDQALLGRNILDKTVLVTGAGGSIGSELCRQIFNVGPARMLLVDSSEYALYAIHRELERMEPGAGVTKPELVPLLASVCDERRMHSIFAAWRPDTLYHAAAYKHVPLVEHNVIEGVRNNVFGTFICASLAREFETSDFVLVSTDKAVRPTNVMGASKRMAELALQAISGEQTRTRYTMVRFGNVLGSSGSVVPLFRQQIAAGGPITVTHREITRFFMTIPEAAELVIQAGAMGSGGQVFILDMGEPVKIVSLARRMIELSGLQVRDEANPHGDIEIAFSGLRPGEKLYEELLIGNNPVATDHPRVMMAQEDYIPLVELERHLAELDRALQRHDVETVRRKVQELVPDYVAAPRIEDWVYQRNAARRDEPLRTQPAPARRSVPD